MLEDVEHALAAQSTPRKVAFEPAESRFSSDGKLLLRLTRYEARALDGDLVEVEETLSGGRTVTWNGEVSRSVGRHCTITPAHIEVERRERGWVSGVTVTWSFDGIAQLVRDRMRDPSSQHGFVTKHLQAHLEDCPPPLRPSVLLLSHPSIRGLNSSQASAISDIAAGIALTLCLGPPGTGKTRTVAAAARALVAAGERVVVTTPTNVAAINALRAILATGETSVRLHVARGYYVEWHSNDFESALWPYMQVTGVDVPERYPAGVPPPTAPPATQPDVLICTLGMLPALGEAAADVSALLLDEAGAAWAGTTYFIEHHLRNVKRVHLFGDDRQLPPGQAAPTNRPLPSLYDAAKRCGHSATRLTCQYRLPSPLAEFLSQELYSGIVASAPRCECDGDQEAVRWVDVPDGAPGRSATGSWFNVEEAQAVLDEMRAIDLRLPRGESRVVITPYREQREVLEKAAAESSQRYGGAWAIATVDSYQGREAEHVILSLVRAGGGAGFMADNRRANVMLSRGRGRLVVVGAHSAWAAPDCAARLLRRLAQRFPPAA